MGGYAIFLAPVAGIICADYWIVKKRKIDIPALYDPYGRYRYWYGINWQAMIAFLVALGPNLPGLVYSVGSTIGGSYIYITEGAKHIYSFDWLFGFVMSVFLYTGLSLLFPDQNVLVEETIRTLEVIDSKLHVDGDGEKSASVGTTALETKSLD
ncbi:putative ncs1 allantoate transporter protein [Phaeoacremonium minimum UCRPA7]|uniref:Putative ncs1 allantoate transporter protein n=1 Tax=Phaeoacremonium minimum (strain UCR-PA7) TaxID=1286976 RepID=R8BBM0_PHAM7|nr:putative ncs1 allantoate transporter protein [Phaeoacremonium minimum UCRPA7]EON96696.1 putative ncs1 allantoate transporter protein [Phaeoacremonium minimum UCRPA7]